MSALALLVTVPVFRPADRALRDTRAPRDVLDGIRADGDIPDVEAFEVAIKGFVEQFSWEQAADDALVIDTDALGIDQVVERTLEHYRAMNGTTA